MYGYVYITTNIINGKIYIGQHVSNTFEPEKYIGSGTILELAIQRYGKENFKNELICECFSQDELDQQEIFYIQYYNSTDRTIGYNITTGGKQNTQTTKNWVWITNGDKSKTIPKDDVEEYLASGWQLGRIISNVVWNKGLTKETSKSLEKSGQTRTRKFQSGELSWAKGSDSWNYLSDEKLLSRIDRDEFVNMWKEEGRSRVAAHYHMRLELVDRILNIFGIQETKEHKSYIYSKARRKQNI